MTWRWWRWTMTGRVSDRQIRLKQKNAQISAVGCLLVLIWGYYIWSFFYALEVSTSKVSHISVAICFLNSNRSKKSRLTSELVIFGKQLDLAKLVLYDTSCMLIRRVWIAKMTWAPWMEMLKMGTILLGPLSRIVIFVAVFFWHEISHKNVGDISRIWSRTGSKVQLEVNGMVLWVPTKDALG